ncbi:MAG: glutathione S-transferase family protein [Gammaproteobacteria bacterium]
MKLYGSIASPYVARVVMFADLKGIELPMEAAPGGMGSDEYRAINPTGKIPALQVNGPNGQQTIAESTVICDYLEAAYPQTPLIPAEPMAQAQTRMIARMTDLYVAPHNTPLNRMGPNRDEALIAQQAELFAKGFAYIEAFMGPGPFAVGDAPTLGDCALAPFIIMLKENVFANFPEVADPTAADGRLGEWWQALQADPVCRKNLDYYAVELEKFLKWLREMMAKRHGG